MKKFLIEVELKTEGFQAEDTMYDVSKALLDMQEDGIINGFTVKSVVNDWENEE